VAAAWWKAFGDPVLDGMVLQALQNNGNLRTARSRVQEYRARAAVIDAGRSPSLDVSASPARSRSRSATGALVETTAYQVGLQASYEVDLWGRLGALSESALASAEAQRAARDAAELSIAATVASGYFNLRGLDAQLALARDTLSSRGESLSRARRLLDAGYSSRLDWAQAESEQRSAAAAVPPLERAVSQQENALSLLMARNPGPLARGRAITDIAAPPIGAGLPSELLRRRPDIAQAEYQLIALDHGLQASRDQLLPSLRLSASAGIQGLSLHQLVDTPTTLWSVGASVLAPLLQRSRLQAGVDVAAAQRDQALFAYEDTVRHALVEVEDALTAIASLDSQQQALAGRTVAAAQVLRIAHSRYRNGYASYLEELDAQRTSYAAQQSLLQSRTALLSASVDLYRALGGGWGAGGG
jgi:NodT family efflux transporter outer membrane factor (OMF) lipoprotein